MPYPRYRKRSRRYGRRSRRNRMGRISRTIGVIRSPEKKYFQYYFSPRQGLKLTLPYLPVAGQSASIRLDTNWRYSSLLTLLSQGIADSQRIGSEIFVKYVQLSVYVTAIPTLDGDTQAATILGSSGMICRYNLMKVRTNNLDVSNDYMDSTTVQGSESPNVFNVGVFKKISLMRNYKTLLDAQHQSHVTSSNLAEEPQPNAFTSGTRCVQHYIKVNRRARFNLDRSVSMDMTDSSNLSTMDLRFGAVANMDACCDMQVLVRVCFTDA